MHLLTRLLLFVASTTAQLLIEGSSFGQSDRLAPNGYNIPGWRVTGEGHQPDILSDKVILTPGYSGNTRGALWTEQATPESQWVAQVDFRATGPEKGGGNLQIWYVQEGQWAIGSSSIYTVGKFDGFAIVIDQHGGMGGSIRGFMNDGTLDYKSYHSVDSLAFGHCDYSYRNLGRPSKLQIKQSDNLFEVVVDDRLCFSTNKIGMPKDYHFGLTAASPEIPDSFEIYKFLLFTDPSTPSPPPFQEPPSYGGSQTNTQQDNTQHTSQYSSSESQFTDLHNRLQTLSHTVDTLMSEIGKLADSSNNRHQDVIRSVQSVRPNDKLDSLDRKLTNIESTLREFDSRFSNMQTYVKDSHSSLAEALPRHMSDVITTNGPRMGLLIFVFIVVQIVLVGAYQVYKRRSKQGPKKYL